MPFLGAAQRADHFLDQIRRGMGNADAEADARAHGGFALFDHRHDGLAMLGLDFAGLDQLLHQFVNGLPAIGGRQIGEDRFQSQNVAKIHRMRPHFA
jgi:hypothetical protein